MTEKITAELASKLECDVAEGPFGMILSSNFIS